MIKEKNNNLRTGIISGKHWISELFYDEENKEVDIAMHGTEYPYYVKAPSGYYLGEPTNPQGMSYVPPYFAGYIPSDSWVINSSIEFINREDPDFVYILLGNPDEGGHAYGNSADENSENINRKANSTRTNVVLKNTDKQFGNFINLTKDRGTYNNSVIVLTADHGMNTVYDAYGERGADIREFLENKGYVRGVDYEWIGGVGPGGVIYGIKNETTLNNIKGDLENYTIYVQSTNETIDITEFVLTKDDLNNGTNPQIVNGKTEQKFPDLTVLLYPHYQNRIYGDLLKGGMNAFALQIPWFPRQGSVQLVGMHGIWAEQFVPIIMHGYGIKVNYSSNEIVETIDIIPTIAEINYLNLPSRTEGNVLDCLIYPSSEDIRLTFESSPSHSPAIASDSYNNLHLAFQVNRSYYNGIYYKKFDSNGNTL